MINQYQTFDFQFLLIKKYLSVFQSYDDKINYLEWILKEYRQAGKPTKKTTEKITGDNPFHGYDDTEPKHKTFKIISDVEFVRNIKLEIDYYKKLLEREQTHTSGSILNQKIDAEKLKEYSDYAKKFLIGKMNELDDNNINNYPEYSFEVIISKAEELTDKSPYEARSYLKRLHYDIKYLKKLNGAEKVLELINDLLNDAEIKINSIEKTNDLIRDGKLNNLVIDCGTFGSEEPKTDNYDVPEVVQADNFNNEEPEIYDFGTVKDNKIHWNGGNSLLVIALNRIKDDFVGQDVTPPTFIDAVIKSIFSNGDKLNLLSIYSQYRKVGNKNEEIGKKLSENKINECRDVLHKLIKNNGLW